MDIELGQGQSKRSNEKGKMVMAALPKNLRPSYSRSIKAYIGAKIFGRGVALKNPIRSTTRAKIHIARTGFSTMRTGSSKSAYW